MEDEDQWEAEPRFASNHHVDQSRRSRLIVQPAARLIHHLHYCHQQVRANSQLLRFPYISIANYTP